MNDEKMIRSLRDLFPVTKNLIYLYNGGVHSCPKPVGDAMRNFIGSWELYGREGCTIGFDSFGRLRKKFAELIHGDERNIVITESTTAGINLAAQIIKPNGNQNIIVTDLEFMSDTYPWIVCHPAEVRFARSHDGRLGTDDIEHLIDAETAAISISAVSAGSGFRIDLKAFHKISMQHNIPLIIDASQALGIIDIDVNEVQPDFLVCTASKWLMGPAGVGFLYVSDKYLAVTPPSVGWFAAVNRKDWDLTHCELYDDARRFQGGIPNLSGIIGALAGIDLLGQIGREFIEKRVNHLTTYAIEGLEKIGVELWTPRNPEERAGIVFFRTPGYKELYQKLKDEKIYCGSFLSGIRIDPNFYNTIKEIDTFLQVVKQHVTLHS